jgi:pyrroloquinoline quinone biosynthesis protein B
MARERDPRAAPRTQSSLAGSADGLRWVLFNASPDIRHQIAATPELQPEADGPLRNSPIKAVVLTNADVDHIAGLLSLRERQAFNIYAASRVLETLEANSIFRVLDPGLVRRIELPLGSTVELEGPEGGLGVSVETYAVPGKIALFLEVGLNPASYGSEEGDTIGVRISAGSGGGAHYIPGCARVDARLKARLDGADCLFFDGTVYTDNEMAEAGVGQKTGRRMGHLAISGPDGSIAALADLRIGRRIFTHINNTNPILDESSPEHQAVLQAGWEIGRDGMEVTL